MGRARSGASSAWIRSWAEGMLCLASLLTAVASTTAAPSAASSSSTGGLTDPKQRWSNSSIAITHNFTRVPGALGIGCDVAAKQNVTLASAEKICGALDACIGFTFRSSTATPVGVVQNVYFKGVNPDCGYSRFGDGICPSGDGTVWQTYLKDYKFMPRTPRWLRHYNLDVVPPRCGDINIEPLFPYDIDDSFIFDYAEIARENFDSFLLEHGECGKVGPHGNPRALPYTKRSNPASTSTPWLGPGGGAGGGPGDPGYPGTDKGSSFEGLCLDECRCSTTGHPVDDQSDCRPGPCPACTDANCGGRCVVCSPSFNKKLSSNSTLIRLWCDPADPACKNGDRTRPPEDVRALADFAPGSPVSYPWTDHNSFPPTSNLTIIYPAVPAADRVNYATTAATGPGAGCFVCAVKDAAGKLQDVPGQTTFIADAAGGGSSQTWTEYRDKGYTCSAKEFKGEIDNHHFNQTAAGCLGAAITKGRGGDSYAEFSGTVYANTGYTRIATAASAFKKIDLSGYTAGAIVVEARYPEAHHCYADPDGGGSLCHFQGFKLALTSLKAPHHHGGRELFGMYKADLAKAKSAPAFDLGTDWATLRLPLTAFSSDWSDFTGECDTKDPDGYQHVCCDASSGMPWQEPCPTTKGLESIIGLSLWSEGVLGNFSISIRSISIEN